MPHVESAKPVDVFSQEFNARSIDFLVLWWSNAKAHDMRGTKSGVMEAIKRALDDAQIKIPFPHVTNTLKEDTPLVTARPVPERV